jgi:Tuberculosis necrotizing toxin
VRGNYGDALLYAASAIPIAGVIGEVAIAAKEAEVGIEAIEAAEEVTAIVPYYPANNGFLGAATDTVLEQGQLIDRVGGSEFSRFFSPVGTPLEARPLPPGTIGDLRTFEVLEPFGVQAGTVAPAFGQIGLGTQFRSYLTLGELIEGGFLKEVVR